MPRATSDFDNQAWIEGLRAGNGDIVAALADRLRAGLTAALSARASAGAEDIEDFTQEAVLRVIERLDAFRGDSRFVTWALAIAIRVGLTHLRRRRPTNTEPAMMEQLLAPDAPIFARGARRELFDALRTAIATDLTPRQREVLLGELNGTPQVVLADRLGANVNAIYKVSHDARRKLRAALERAGFEAEMAYELLAETETR